MLCGFSLLTMAQQNVTAYVLDAETKMPIDLVAVVSPEDYTITNSEGGFVVKAGVSDEIKLSHISYQTKRIGFQQLGDTVFLQPKVYELAEVFVVPRAVIIRELTAVWDKYDKLLAKKKEKDFSKQTFYYRQLTQNNDLYTECMECFFTAPTSIRVMEISLQEGRFAGIKKDTVERMTNFLIFPE
jgi:hypothetical protein